MGKVILSLSSNFEDLKKNVLKHIDLESDQDNNIIVPDRFSLLAELAIFEEKNTSSVFNANVMPISAFANFLFEKAGIFYETISMFEQTLLTRHALQRVNKGFECLPKQISPNLLQEVTKTISKLKSSNVKVEDLKVENVSDVL